MRLSDLLGSEVFDRDGKGLGHVHDVRLVQDGPLQPNMAAALRLDGLVVGRGGIVSLLGYDRAEVRGPWLLKALAGRLQAGTLYVPWTAVADRDGEVLTLSVGAADLGPPAVIQGTGAGR